MSYQGRNQSPFLLALTSPYSIAYQIPYAYWQKICQADP